MPTRVPLKESRRCLSSQPSAYHNSYHNVKLRCTKLRRCDLTPLMVESLVVPNSSYKLQPNQTFVLRKRFHSELTTTEVVTIRMLNVKT